VACSHYIVTHCQYFTVTMCVLLYLLDIELSLSLCVFVLLRPAGALRTKIIERQVAYVFA